MDNTTIIPNTFKGLIVHDNNIIYSDINSNNIDDEHALIKVKEAGLNYLDLAYINSIKKLPEGSTFNSLGLTGTGQVLKVGGKCDNSILNKRVSFISFYNDNKAIRSLSEYALVHHSYVITIPDNIDNHSAASLLYHPIKSRIIFDNYIKNLSSIIQEYDESYLSQIINKLALNHGIKVINIVKKDNIITEINSIGAICLNMNSTTFIGDLTNAIRVNQPMLFINYEDPYLPSLIIDKLPNNSNLLCAGDVNNYKLSGFSSMSFIFQGKSFKGFSLYRYLERLSEDERRKLFESVRDEFLNNSAYQKEVNKVYKLEEIVEVKKFIKEGEKPDRIILTP
jgi:NADPH:quinone reductase-like Zn-dependent oxidoreductase